MSDSTNPSNDSEGIIFVWGDTTLQNQTVDM